MVEREELNNHLFPLAMIKARNTNRNVEKGVMISKNFDRSRKGWFAEVRRNKSKDSWLFVLLLSQDMCVQVLVYFSMVGASLCLGTMS